MRLNPGQDSIRTWSPDGVLIVSGPHHSGRETALAALAITLSDSGRRIMVTGPHQRLESIREALLTGFETRLPPLEPGHPDRTPTYEFALKLLDTSPEDRKPLTAAVAAHESAIDASPFILPDVHFPDGAPSESEVTAFINWAERRRDTESLHGPWHPPHFLDPGRTKGIDHLVDFLETMKSIAERARDEDAKLPYGQHRGSLAKCVDANEAGRVDAEDLHALSAFESHFGECDAARFAGFAHYVDLHASVPAIIRHVGREDAAEIADLFESMTPH